MSERYAALLDLWKRAGEKAKQAEQRLNKRFEAFFTGSGDEPTDAEHAEVTQLREAERKALEAALEYLRQTAKPGPR